MGGGAGSSGGRVSGMAHASATAASPTAADSANTACGPQRSKTSIAA
jgi:hypothetical protein